MKTRNWLWVGTLGLLGAGLAFAQGSRPSPDQMATDYRIALMRVMQGTSMPLTLMGRGRQPYDAALARKDSERLAMLASMVPDAFERDTTAAGIKSDALPIVWKDHAEFLKLAADLKSKADELAAATKSGNEADIKKAMTAAGGTCGACHDKYRQALE